MKQKKRKPKTELEKEEEKEKEKDLAEKKPEEESEKPVEEVEDLTPEQMIREIMKNCAGTLDQITVPPNSNEFLANKTNYGDTMNKTLENDIFKKLVI